MGVEMDRIIRGLKVGFVGSALLASTVTVAEEGFSFLPRAFAGWGDYSLSSGTFEADYLNPDTGEVVLSVKGPLLLGLDEYQGSGSDRIKINAPIGGIGASLGYAGFYFDAYYQKLFSDGNSASCYDIVDIDGQGYAFDCRAGQANPVWTENYSAVDGDRDEYALTLGYQIADSFSVFAGFRDADMEWDQTRRDSDGYEHSRDGVFELDGPFVGLNYTYTNPEMFDGAFTVKGAYGQLDGALTLKDDGSFGGVSWAYITELEGEADAYSIGFAYAGFLSDMWQYSLGVDYHLFDFDMDGGGDANTEGVDDIFISFKKGSMEEELIAFRASISYMF